MLGKGMEIHGTDHEVHQSVGVEYDRKMEELRAFDETKAGVKGLVDAGIKEVPSFFIHPPADNSSSLFITDDTGKSQFSFPIIDLEGIDEDSVKRKETVEKVLDASENWGFFQVVNHGIPCSVLDEMLDGVKKFYEQDNEVKKKWYSRDTTKRVVYNSNFDLYTAPSANWRDTFHCIVAPNPPTPQELPPILKAWIVQRALLLYVTIIQHVHSQNLLWVLPSIRIMIS